MARKQCLVCFGGLLILVAICLAWPSGVWAAEKKNPRGCHQFHDRPGRHDRRREKWAYEQAVADINKKGGVLVKEYNKKLPIRLVFAVCTQCARSVRRAMERLIKASEVDLALSGDTTPKNLAAAVVAEKYRLFFLIDLAWTPVVEQQNYKWVACYFFTPDSASRVPFQI